MRLFLIKKKKHTKKCISFSRGLFFQLMLCYMIPGSYKDIIHCHYYNRLYSKATVGRNHFVKHTIIANLSFPSELTYLDGVHLKEWSLLTTMLTLWYLDNIQVPLKISQCVTKALHSITTPAAAG